MDAQNSMTQASTSILPAEAELRDFHFDDSSTVAPPAGVSPDPESETVADSKPLEGEILAPTKDAKKVAATATDDAQFATVANRIRARTQRGVLMLVENGHDLIAVKEKMGHGCFGDWLKREFGWSERTAQNYMNAAKAFKELVARDCAPESIALLPPTLLYDFDRRSNEHKDKCVKAIKSGIIGKAVKRAKKAKTGTAATSKTASAQASTDKDQDAAEELAKRIAEVLPHAVRQEIDGHTGFNSHAFGRLLSKAIVASFGVRSSGGTE